MDRSLYEYTAALRGDLTASGKDQSDLTEGYHNVR